MQLDLLGYQPTPQEMEPPRPDEFKVGELLSGQTLTGATAKGPYRCKSASGLLLLGLGERPIAMILPTTAVRSAGIQPLQPSESAGVQPLRGGTFA